MQLVINTPGTFITQKDGCFRLKQKEKQFDISPLKVESIIISNQAMISSQTVVLALEHNIDIIFLDTYGDPMGRIWFSKMGSTALIRRRQLEAMDSSLGLQLVICILSGLDPYVGFLHTDNYNKKSLVFDLIEPFRIYGEHTAVYLFTGKKMKDDYFDAKEGAVSLNQTGKPVGVHFVFVDKRKKLQGKSFNT